MTEPVSNKPGPVHFVGIAGAGMSALAELFVKRGYAVTGCDASLATAGDLRVGHAVLHGMQDPPFRGRQHIGVRRSSAIGSSGHAGHRLRSGDHGRRRVAPAVAS